MDRLGTAYPHNLALLNCPQELGLQGKAHITNLVQQNGSVVGQFKKPHLSLFPCACKSAAFIAEQLRFHQRLWDSAAVDFDERLVVAVAVVVDVG